MKLSTSLLSALIVGLALQTATSCTKEKTDPKVEKSPKTGKETKTEPFCCPACGMG